jgi:hypothetical protein
LNDAGSMIRKAVVMTGDEAGPRVNPRLLFVLQDESIAYNKRRNGMKHA